jgi:hypothetical protein
MSTMSGSSPRDASDVGQVAGFATPGVLISTLAALIAKVH